MTTATQEQRETPVAVPDCDLQAHVEDDILVNRIVNGKLVLCRWNDLTEDERREAYTTLFHIYE